MNTNHAQFTQNSSLQRDQRRSDQQPPRGVWQDKGAANRARIATKQPAPLKKGMRPQPLNNSFSRSQKRTVHKRQTIHTTLHLKPRVRAELERVAAEKALSTSATGAALLEYALQQNLSTQHAALLDPIINKAIAKHMRSYSTRLAVLLVRVAFASEQTRSLVTNILGRQPGITPETLNTILDGSSKAARGKITYKTPELEDIIAEVEKWFTEQESKDNAV